ncbi:MAG: hypothetical protein ACTSWC_11430 [Promethearchaeota archaeon]
MAYRILMDLSHYERIHSLPDKLFLDKDYLFSFINFGDQIPSVDKLQKYDLLLIGDPKPKYFNEILWNKEELRNIKQYVRRGGKMLITSSNRGDFNLSPMLGGLRIFQKLTGVALFPNFLTFSLSPRDYFGKKSILHLHLSSQSLPFGDFTPNDYLAWGKSTILVLHEEYPAKILLTSPESTQIHDYVTKKKKYTSRQPLLVFRQYHEGLVVTSASSCFFLQNSQYGIEVEANGKFFLELINWILSF